MAGRLALLLLGGFGVFALVAGLLFLDERRERRVENFARTLSVRMIAMVEALEVAPAAERQRLETALSDRRVRVRLLGERPQGVGWRPPPQINEDAARHVQRLRPRPVLMRLDTHPTDHRPRLLVAVGLEGGAWGEFAVRTPREPRPGVYFWMGLAALLVALALVWGAHRMTRPLRRLPWRPTGWGSTRGHRRCRSTARANCARRRAPSTA